MYRGDFTEDNETCIYSTDITAAPIDPVELSDCASIVNLVNDVDDEAGLAVDADDNVYYLRTDGGVRRLYRESATAPDGAEEVTVFTDPDNGDAQRSIWRFALNPAGTHVVVAVQDHLSGGASTNFHLVDVATDAKTALSNVDPGFGNYTEVDPVFSADGESVAFSARWDASPALVTEDSVYVVPTNASTPPVRVWAGSSNLGIVQSLTFSGQRLFAWARFRRVTIFEVFSTDDFATPTQMLDDTAIYPTPPVESMNLISAIP